MFFFLAYFTLYNRLDFYIVSGFIFSRLLKPLFLSKQNNLQLPLNISFILPQNIKASLVAQMVKNLPAMQETPVWFLGREDPWRRDRLPTPVFLGFPGGSDSKRIHLQCGKPGFDPWVGKIPWRRAWQPTPVFLPGESPWTEEPGGLQSTGLQRVGHNWATKHINVINLNNLKIVIIII